jgi:hypothetical protein
LTVITKLRGVAESSTLEFAPAYALELGTTAAVYTFWLRLPAKPVTSGIGLPSLSTHWFLVFVTLLPSA